MFSQMKDTKHIRWDIHSVTLVMPQGWDFGALGVPRGSFFQTWSCGIPNWWGWRVEQNTSKIFIIGRSKGQISLNFGYHVNFNFSYQTLCVFDRKHIEQSFPSVAGIMPQWLGVKKLSVEVLYAWSYTGVRKMTLKIWKTLTKNAYFSRWCFNHREQ